MGGPAAEPTPEPSPTTESPPPSSLPSSASLPAAQPAHQETQPVVREKRRFAPQLLESTRRSRRTGDVGPATRPGDKTDILPYSKHLYSFAPKNKKKQPRRPGHARRESCDDEIAEHVLNLNKLDMQKRMEEVAMLAFPNSTIRLGGAEHFFVREGSDDDVSPRGRDPARVRKPVQRRDSSEDNVNWMVKEMQKHAGQLAASERPDREQKRDSLASDFSGSMSGSMMSEGPPDNTFAFTNSARHTIRDSISSLTPIGEDARGGAAGYFSSYGQPSDDSLGDNADVDMAGATAHQVTRPSQIPPETGFHQTRGAFGRFYGNTFGNSAKDKAAEKALFRLKTQKSPPMAGSDLTFRMCPSPKATKLESDQTWDVAAGAHVEENRDATEQNGLWRGYCFTTHKNEEAIVASPRAQMIMTPMIPGTPYEHSDPSTASDGTLAPYPISAEPTPVGFTASKTSEHRSRAGQPKGLHMLMGLDQRLQQEKAAAELDERIAAEFDDQFVTQVYNYLSLGYPATARAYDEELSKISRISTEELAMEDEAVMDGIGSSAKGHIKISMDLDTVDDRRCPRWKALKEYIFEWARQHPDLDGITPLAWGVAERRGSWGI